MRHAAKHGFDTHTHAHKRDIYIYTPYTVHTHTMDGWGARVRGWWGGVSELSECVCVCVSCVSVSVSRITCGCGCVSAYGMVWLYVCAWIVSSRVAGEWVGIDGNRLVNG